MLTIGVAIAAAALCAAVAAAIAASRAAAERDRLRDDLEELARRLAEIERTAREARDRARPAVTAPLEEGVDDERALAGGRGRDTVH